MYNLEEFEKYMKLFNENMELYSKLMKDYTEEEKREKGIDTMIYIKVPEKPRYFFNGIAVNDIDVVVPNKVVIVTIVNDCFGFGFTPINY